MKSLTLLIVLVLASCATQGPTADTSTSELQKEEALVTEEEQEMIDISGNWKGNLVVGSRKIPFVFRVIVNEDGNLAATLDSPSENISGIPVESVTTEGNTVVFSLPITAAKFEAVFEAESDRLIGKWLQRGATIDLVVERFEGTDVTRKPQDPIPPYPYNSVEAAFRNEGAEITLKGTVTFPKGSGPFPGVVLISGSGQQNRDEEVFGHKPFLVLADALTRAGIVVLRYDDRGAGESEGLEILAESTTEDFAGDALSAYRFLSSLTGIDKEKIGMIGHSEGGMIAPTLASQNPEIAFIVLLAGPGVKGSDLILAQSIAFLKASGMSEDAINIVADLNSRVYNTILETPDNEAAKPVVTSILKEAGLSQTQIDGQLPALLSPAYRYILAYDPVPALSSLTIPVLALNGTLDLQVPYEANLRGIEDALESAPTNAYRIEALPGLNHLFQTATTGLVSEYGQIEETFSPVALDIITNWIVEVIR